MRVELVLTLGSLLVTSSLRGADESRDALEARAAEQERQIHQLELQNLRLREQIGRLEERLGELGETPPPSAPGSAANFEPVPVAPKEASKPAQQKAPTHVVRAGESLSKIARMHGVTTAELITLNNIPNPSLIREGQVITLPSPAADEDQTTAVNSRTHTVQAGETMYSIARDYGIAMEDLQLANPKVNPRSLAVGQKLRLPTQAKSTPAPTESSLPRRFRPVAQKAAVRSVPVEEKITVSAFARRHRTNLSRLNALNGLDLEADTPLAKGTRLYVNAQP
jgi:membrane-bound lytic murein transglycosylase D